MVSPFFFFLTLYIILSNNIRECTTNSDPQGSLSTEVGGVQAQSTDLQGTAASTDANVVSGADGSQHGSPVSPQVTGVTGQGDATAAATVTGSGGGGGNQVQAQPQAQAPTQSDQAGTTQTNSPNTHQSGSGSSETNGSTSVVTAESGGSGTTSTIGVDGSNQGGNSSAPVAKPSPKSIPKLSFPVKSSLLKKNLGIKVTGQCGVFFRVVFSPHLTLAFETDDGKIELVQELKPLYKLEIKFADKCEKTKNFKFLAIIKESILTLRWEVPENESGTKKETKKFKLPKFDIPITSILVHSGDEQLSAIESKSYTVKDVLPEKCSKIASECFLSGSIDVQKCYHCSLLVNKTAEGDECLNFVNSEDKSRIESSIVAAASDEESSENKLGESIDNILRRIYKTDEINMKRELLTLDNLDDELKEEIKNYCNLLKEVDVSGTLDNHELGNETEVFNNLTRLLKMHAEEKNISLSNKLRNAAICIKNVDEWIINKRGLVLPEETNDYFEKVKDMPDAPKEEEEYEDEIKITEDMFEKDEDGIVDLTKSDKDMKLLSPYFINNKYCNDDYCDRWKDKTSCVSKIEVEEQGYCGVCWVFASKLHLETIRCMRGYGHFRSSPLYVANCSKRKPEYRCSVGSNPIEFLQIIEERGFLPLESDHPYSYTQVDKKCPTPKRNWVNLWGDTELLQYINYSKRKYSKGYITYESAAYRDNMDLFIKIVKREIQNKGSVIVYIKTKDVFSYDFNGGGVHNLCGDAIPDHAANIIGYGKYINKKGEKRSYWLIRNSWGYYWGDEGNFKLDMYGPSNCDYHFIHTVLVFKVNLGMVELPSQHESYNPFNFFLKNSPQYYHELYYKNYNPEESKELPKNYENIDVPDQVQDNNFKDNTENDNDVNNRKESDENFVMYGTDSDNGDSSSSPPAEKKNSILHYLKDIKKNKVKTNLVTYLDEKDLGNEHSCSRVYSNDPTKNETCRKFCVDNFSKCKDHYSPGYCLTKLSENTNGCSFCFV
ncbi:serine repeat antigen, putative [Plasmodium relictum]|uniref:Serine repeat antigen, putative n=1 Tax=Plasmodium relictum TaxID=85471 RepID=A0A1J1H5T7_PLARL|nr:serine repeat antigen, putative [Plasmodium relictum]CRG98796.1 serine repeat antigen, putative [Plasmodium relictum]